VVPPDFEKKTIPDDTFAYFSNFGPVVKIAAPGVNILSTYNGTGYAVDSGTSMATPFVSGAATLYKAEHPNALPSEVTAAIMKSGSVKGTACDSQAHGYFSGDLDKLPEPLLYRGFLSNSTIASVPSKLTQ
jgi:subtilisin